MAKIKLIESLCSTINVRLFGKKGLKIRLLQRWLQSLMPIRQLNVVISPLKAISKTFHFEESSKLVSSFKCNGNLTFSFWDIVSLMFAAKAWVTLFRYKTCPFIPYVINAPSPLIIASLKSERRPLYFDKCLFPYVCTRFILISAPFQIWGYPLYLFNRCLFSYPISALYILTHAPYPY